MAALSDNIRQRKQPSLSIFGPDSEDDENQPIISPELDFSQTQLLIIGLLTLVAAYFRLWNLSNPHKVVFDEVHFGKFAGKYINGTYFFDVHPPLAKMMFAGMGKLVGYDGRFDFKEIGLDYLVAQVPYYGMRLMPAFLGLLTIPICYLTIKQSGHSTAAAVLGATLLTFENALITQSRLILLDSPLIFFTTLTILMWTNFCRYLKRPFTPWWWTWLALTGISMGLTVSCKYVGLFLVAAIGVATIKQLWDLVANINITPREIGAQLAGRALCLIMLPLVVYVLIFQIHFMVLSRHGDGAGFMSPEFQSTLRGGFKGETFRDIYYGSEVTIRHEASNKGYLHSHAHSYPDGSKQQQITLYPHRDENNVFRLTKSRTLTELEHNDTKHDLERVKNGDVVRLVHISTDRRLHSHDVRGPISKADYENEVSGYGWKGFAGDANDEWRVEILDSTNSDSTTKDRLMAIQTKFRLIHTQLGCALFSNEKKLPSWGFNQTEVICMKEAKKPKSTWRIVTNRHPDMPADAVKVRYSPPGLLSKVIESTRVMFNVNNGLTSTHPFDSRPESWPILRRGISFWSADNRQIYLFGNPFVWWVSSIAVVAYAVAQVVLHFTDLRGVTSTKWGSLRSQFTYTTGFAFTAWFFHYMPFFIMQRQLFLHHYLPALYMALLVLVYSLDTVTARVQKRTRYLVFGVVALLALRYFHIFSPLAYGTVWTRPKCEAARWFKSWDFDCKVPPMDPTEIKAAADSPWLSKGTNMLAKPTVVVPKPADNLNKVD
ncbi:glycosyltransferase family 39 protein [Dimargaris cristalligena]|uniref:Dolichyl-phosphate-mannose--protein mannosyltransferase n=1 Tax=Dimargaris cristalligena TaxID=215637 RepID=A0A4P9ZX59_9FUNG|nr:glycosyltransferase family 39 protein [Dimargaris cristalligena]|eukprot:RKP37591.1 glycosyltransferase family 39 protein [Dimargaris cristalligena]